MTLEAMISELSHREKLDAMDLLWRELAADPDRFPSPDWHGQVIAERLARPSSKKSFRLEEAQLEVRRRLEARRAQG